MTMVNTVAVRIPNWVGDVVMSTPALRCIRNNYPSATITGVVGHSVRNILHGTPWLDKTCVYHRNRGWGLSGTAEFLRCVKYIRNLDAELGFILPNSFSSALMMAMGGVSNRVGFQRDARGPLLTVSLPRPCHPDGSFRPTYMAEYYLKLCEHVGLDVNERRTELPYTSQDVAEVHAVLRSIGINPSRRLILFHMTAGYGPSKLWSKSKFARLATSLHNEFDAEICGIGAPSSGEYIREVNALCEEHIHDLSDCGINLHLLKALVGMCDLLVSTDSGPRHYGVALGRPTVCIMGPTDPDYSTSGRKHDHVVRVDVECGPCQNKLCSRDHACMHGIQPDMVLSTCYEAMQQNG